MDLVSPLNEKISFANSKLFEPGSDACGQAYLLLCVLKIRNLNRRLPFFFFFYKKSGFLNIFL